MILIGSRALAIRAPHLLGRKPKDFDFVATREETQDWIRRNSGSLGSYTVEDLEKKIIVKGSSICEFEIIREGTSSEMLRDLVEGDPESLETKFGWVPTLDMLFTIKSTHTYLKNSPFFFKTAIDYHVLKRAGAKVRPEYQEFCKLRKQETYDYKHPSLNQSKESFFKDDAIDYRFDHDSVHLSVARLDRPAYTYYLKDGEEVQCCKEKFFSCPEEVRIAGVVEEAAVLAIERSLVPHENVKTPKEAWIFALSKVCSSITSGFFRAWAYQNIFTILKHYPEGYWEKFQADVHSGKVKPYTGKRYGGTDE